MKQTTEERVAALVTLLPKLVEHLDAHAQIRSCLGGIQLEGDAPRPPRLREYELELWEAIERRNTFRWRLRAVARALLALEETSPRLARAVWTEYVVPFAAWNPRDRRAWAAEGVWWMQREIPGEIPFCAENAPRNEAGRIRRRNTRIREAVARGESVRAIATKEGCSPTTVMAVKHGKRIVAGHLV